MTKRLLPHTLLSIIAIASLAACNGPGDEGGDVREPYIDDWETVAELPAAQFTLLSVGDRLTSDDNFANRGDVEIHYEPGTDLITVEMQRFTVAESEMLAQANFDKMQYWGYALSTPEPPADDNTLEQCSNTDADAVSTCYIRNYYDGLTQPIRDGANFRVTIPEGWPGQLLVVTSDNLGEGVETYPDRSDVIVDGVNGDLSVDMDSGNVQVRVDPSLAHYSDCSLEASQTCEEMGYVMGCGCTVPTNISIANNSGQASNITVDVGATDNWYSMILENRGDFSASDEFVCAATIDCAPFDDCVIDEAYANDPAQERAEVNFPNNGMAAEGAGIRIELTSDSCANITYVDGIEDHGAEELPEEKRGEVSVCVGCLSDL